MDKKQIIFDVPDISTIGSELEIVFNDQVIPLDLTKNMISRITLNIQANDVPKLEIEYLGYRYKKTEN